MKRYQPKTRLLMLIFALVLTTPTAFSQCPFTFAFFGSGAAPTPGNSATLQTCSFIGEATTATGVVVGQQFTVSVTYNVAPPNPTITPYVVVYDATFTPVAFGSSTVTFTALTSGPYYTIPFADAFCTYFDPNFGCNSTLWSNVTPLPPPVNNLPCSAIPLTSSTTCSYSTYTNAHSTAAPSVPAPGCVGYLGGDVWFSLVIPASGNVVIDTETGEMLDGGMAIYSGACGALTLIECDDDDSPNGAIPMISISGGTPGQTIYIRVWEVGNNNNGTFGICAVESSTCGTPLTNDYCEGPTALFQGPNDFSASTPANYTSDTPGNLMASFCGSIENNAWYSFTAQSATEIFDFVSVNNCATNFGIQAVVYEVIPDANGCCSSLNVLSNCFSPGTQSLGTVTASPLVIGKQYMLLVDGFSGDACDFTIANWSTVLPVELSNFYGLSLTEHNAIRWETNSETDNDFFNVLRSYDGITFETIGEVDGIGYSQDVNHYQFDDADFRSGTVYY
ncbi:MAG: hypothetical protein P8P74_10690 [Crocinitomicaceae bacterium]|nr:hypothetical protein [Crocinitomicaceae bacterium]